MNKMTDSKYFTTTKKGLYHTMHFPNLSLYYKCKTSGQAKGSYIQAFLLSLRFTFSPDPEDAFDKLSC